MAGYRLWVNAERTVLVRLWDNGQVEVATRAAEGDVWGPPAALFEEKVSLASSEARAGL